MSQTTDSQNNNHIARGAGPQGIAYAWCHKDAIWKIRKGFDATTYLDQALAVYMVHSELASDAQGSTYQATRRKIAERAGVSVRRVTEIHKTLRNLNLLTWEQQFVFGTQELGENRYTLLMCCTPCPTSGTERKRENCTVVEQSSEESCEERLNDATGVTAPVNATPRLSAHRSGEAYEEQLMGRLRGLLGEDEMARAGGNWRANWVRRHPNLVESGLNELQQKVKESERGYADPIRNRAAWLVDWLMRINKEQKERLVKPRNFIDRNAGTFNEGRNTDGLSRKVR